MAVCFGLGALLRPYTSPQIDPLNYTLHTPVVIIAITGILSITLMVLYIVWVFKARTALQHYALMQFQLEIKMNVFWTLLFGVYYVSYCINALPDKLASACVMASVTEQEWSNWYGTLRLKSIPGMLAIRGFCPDGSTGRQR